MASQNARIEFTAKDEQIVNALRKLNNNLDKTERKLEQVSKTSQKSNRMLSGGFENARRHLLGVATSILGAGGVLAGFHQMIAANRQFRMETDEAALSMDKLIRKFNVQSGLRGLRSKEAQRGIGDAATRNAVSNEAAFSAATQLVSSGATPGQASGALLDEFLKVLAATNQVGEDVDQAELAKSLLGFLSANRLGFTGDNIARVGRGTQALFKGTNLQLSGLPALSKEAAGLSRFLSPEEQLASFSVLLDEGIDAPSAAVALRNIVSRASTVGAKPKASKGLKTLGIKAEAIDFVGEDFNTVLDRLETAIRGTQEKDRAGALTKIFSEAGVAPLLSLIAKRSQITDRVGLQQDTDQFTRDVREAQTGPNAALNRLRAAREQSVAQDGAGQAVFRGAFERVLREDLEQSPLALSVRLAVFDALRFSGLSKEFAAEAAVARNQFTGNQGLSSRVGEVAAEASGETRFLQEMIEQQKRTNQILEQGRAAPNRPRTKPQSSLSK